MKDLNSLNEAMLFLWRIVFLGKSIKLRIPHERVNVIFDPQTNWKLVNQIRNKHPSNKGTE